MSFVTNGQLGEFPQFSLIPWATGPLANERYSSPPIESLAAATYPMANGVNGRLDDHDPSTHSTLVEDSSTQTNPSGTTPPPIDAVDIGIVPEHVARAVQEAGPPPRSPDDVPAVDRPSSQRGDEMDIE
jgi:hypothetical protein